MACVRSERVSRAGTLMEEDGVVPLADFAI